MPQRLVGLVGLLLVLVYEVQAQGEVVFSIDDRPVDRTEFAYQQAKSNLSEKAFRSAYIDYKLKVREAESQGLDTTATFKAQYSFYSHRLLKLLLVEERKLMEEERRIMSRIQRRMKSTEWVKAAHVSIDLPQQADRSLENRAKKWMDSVYTTLREGADFNLLVEQYAEEGGVHPAGFCVRAEELPWLPIDKYLKEWTERWIYLEKDKMSEPFFSPKGIHIVKWSDKSSTVSFELLKPSVDEYIERLGDANPAVDKESVTLWRQGNLELLERKYPTLKLRLRELYDGLLVTALDRRYTGDMILEDASLERYFVQHRERYKREPRYRGAIIRSKRKKVGKSIKKRLKKLPMENWQDAFDQIVTDRGRSWATMELGFFEFGKNAAVDKLIFKCGDYRPDPSMPYTVVVGKKMKRDIDDYREVKAQLIRDFQSDYKERLFKQLREKYRVKINGYD